jgi:uncharacterized protein (DUF1778 family)
VRKPTSKDAPKSGDLARGDYPVVPVRIHPDNIELIEEAAWRSKKKRAHFIEQAALEKAAKVLGRSIPVPEAA